MGLFAKLFGQPSSALDDEPYEQQRADLDQALAIWKQFGLGLQEDCDELPNGSGSFGSASNPIPVNGPVGETVYLNRLRAPSGVGFYYHRLGSTSSPTCEHSVDHFELLAVDGACHIELYFDMYHSRRSQKVPAGLTRTPWRQMEAPIRAMIKLDLNGSKGMVGDFPFGLPDAIENSPQLRSLSPGLRRTVAARMRARLEELERRVDK